MTYGEIPVVADSPDSLLAAGFAGTGALPDRLGSDAPVPADRDHRGSGVSTAEINVAAPRKSSQGPIWGIGDHFLYPRFCLIVVLFALSFSGV